MGVLIGVFFGAALLITLAATVLTNVKLWEFIRETPHLYRQLPSEKRRTALAIYGLVACELAVVLIAPFGVRDTLTYFVIVPFVLIIPVAVIATGVRGFRGQRHGRRPNP